MNRNFSTEDFEKIKEFIYRKTAISIEHKTSFAKLSKHIDDFKSYFFKLRFDDENAQEFQKLVNLITNNETYFYREKEHFDVLLNHLLPSLDKELDKRKTIKILSAPCSSGEEVYSILIHILHNSDILNYRDIKITGIDIDSDVICKAKEARYCKDSIRSVPSEMIASYFDSEGESFILKDELKKFVEFKVANVYDRSMIQELGEFDVIFSRNMFIYFDDISRKDVALNFYDILSDNGVVILGNAEHMSRVVSVFNTTKIDGVFVHKK
jgi:chemotaxis protein methyltransferase CheR